VCASKLTRLDVVNVVFLPTSHRSFESALMPFRYKRQGLLTLSLKQARTLWIIAV
jgi:hypothetical protein